MSDIYNIFEFLNLKFQVRIDFILKVDLIIIIIIILQSFCFWVTL